MAYTTINKSTDYFRTKLYTGNASNDRAITFDESPNMQPDFIWIKNRSAAQSHALFDAIRGATKRISSNSNSAESTENTNLDSFDTNGFTVDNEAIVNGSGNNMVAWNWKANGAGSADTSGTINSTVSANTTAGFSIVKYVGDGTGGNNTIAHGLGVAPEMVFYKNLDSARNWIVYNKSIGATKNLYLDLNNAENTASNTFNNVAPTSTLLNVNDSVGVNESGDNHIAYCFASISGYSKIGSYVGNANTDGPFIYTGFKPALFIHKRANGAGGWYIYDNKRGPFNEIKNTLKTEEPEAEDSNADYNDVDFLSNGVKIREDNNDINASGDTYIYLAFAEEPLVANVGNSIPATAR